MVHYVHIYIYYSDRVVQGNIANQTWYITYTSIFVTQIELYRGKYCESDMVHYLHIYICYSDRGVQGIIVNQTWYITYTSIFVTQIELYRVIL